MSPNILDIRTPSMSSHLNRASTSEVTSEPTTQLKSNNYMMQELCICDHINKQTSQARDTRNK